MSSKEQFRDFIKRDKQTIAILKKELAEKDEFIKLLKKDIRNLHLDLIEKNNKKWWQFWK